MVTKALTPKHTNTVKVCLKHHSSVCLKYSVICISITHFGECFADGGRPCKMCLRSLKATFQLTSTYSGEHIVNYRGTRTMSSESFNLPLILGRFMTSSFPRVGTVLAMWCCGTCSKRSLSRSVFPLFLRFSIGKCRNCPFFRAFH